MSQRMSDKVILSMRRAYLSANVNTITGKLIMRIGLLALLCLFAACTSQEYNESISNFGVAAVSVVQQMKDNYRLVNDTVVQSEIMKLVAKNGPFPENPSTAFPPFLKDEDINIRYKMLDALQAYATKLAGLTGKTATDLDTESTKLAASLGELAKSGRLQHSLKEVKGVTVEELNAGAAGIEAIGKLLINRKITAKLPSILKETEPKIEAIANILILEIGNTPTASDVGGLRDRLWRAFEELIQDQPLDPVAGTAKRKQDITMIATLVTSRQNADATLEKTQSALKKLLSAHQALVKVDASPATFKAAITSFWAEAKAAQDFYAKLPAK